VSEQERVTSNRTEGEGEARSAERARGGAVSLSHRERPVNLNFFLRYYCDSMLQNPHFTLTRETVDENFPGARVRAGLLLVNNSKLLLVKEMSQNIGPPKGMVDWSKDKSVLNAALRIYREETGLNILNKSFEICSTVYMYYREHFKELIVYYAIFIKYPPRIHIKKRLIGGFMWVNMRQGVSGKWKCSEASASIFRAIDNSLLFMTTNKIRVRCEHATLSNVSVLSTN
jgi:hypothetical protein